MYLPLNKTGVSNALTDETKFPCPSLVPVKSPSFSPFYPEIPYQNREYFEHTEGTSKKNVDTIFNKHHEEAPINKTIVRYHVQENFSKNKKEEKKEETSKGLSADTELLPVMDCKFNFREICKQCILLEDHLTHDEKRCYDCCIKHFLALEALSEEAIQLDNKLEHSELAKDLPTNIRKIQKMWHENPNKNAHECAQELRKIRKNLMENCFSVVFEEKCSNGVCKLKF